MPGIGPIKIQKMLEQSPDLSAAFNAKGYCSLLQAQADWQAVEKDLAWAAQADCTLIDQSHPAYPPLLAQIHAAPPLLFVQGALSVLCDLQIAMVGSRQPTPLGLEHARSFAEYFADAGIGITSGLALGIDAAAHRGALHAQGKTLAVLANGLDQIYPRVHRGLAQQILDTGGALISEFPIGVPPLASQFPRRNRIISGLAVGTLVVEAAVNSGSLITAKQALEQGREVFAIPGSIHNPLVKGCHALIQAGAKLVQSAEDVLEELEALKGYWRSTKDSGVQKPQHFALAEAPLSPAQTALLAQVGYEPRAMDSILSDSGLTSQLASSMLLELELQGYVRCVPGGYVRDRKSVV